mmetsp:Transcript_14897/g.28005  ORF Transcript_14897/g.28005 Transcript_14897/m.28005 type:complete len:862 (-) Transcript_14897:2613-5198(-)
MRNALDYHPIDADRALSAITLLRHTLAAFGDDLALESLRIHSMRKQYSLDLLTRFYSEHMIPHFPLEEERDELDDWVYCLDPVEIATHDYEAKRGPLMDILLVLCDSCNSERHGRRKEPFILAGVAFEYYQQAQVGLISYVTTHGSFRRRGIMKALHPLAINALDELHRLSHLEKFGHEPVCRIKAMLAETNTIDAGDASQEDIEKRHQSLFALGYRFVEFPYIQPPLGTDMKTFDDVMLLVYQGIDSSNLWFPEWRVVTSILFDFVSDFTMSVFGYGDGSAASLIDLEFWKFQKWFGQICSSTVISRTLPWDIITPRYKKMYTDVHDKFYSNKDETRHKVVAVIGAGVAGLAASVEMAKNATCPLLVQLIEANDCVGGRVRTILTKDKSGQYVNEQLVKRYEAFSPWTVPLGAEFVHGIGSSVNHLIKDCGWETNETFDFSLSESDAVQIFLNGKCYSLRTGTSQDKHAALINEAEQIWGHLSENGGKCLESEHLQVTDDMCLSKFVDLQMKGRSPEDIATVTLIIDAMYAKTAGTSTMFYGLNEGHREESNWDYEECNFRTKRCFGEIIEYFRSEIDRINKSYEAGVSEVIIQVIMNSPVVRVSSENSINARRRVIVSTRNGNQYMALKAIVAVPLAVLKSGKIEFSGLFSLPGDKRRAIENVNMFSGMKAHLLLRKGIDVRDSLLLDCAELFFCPGEIFSQVWLQRDDRTYFITGFVVAEDRERLLLLVQDSEMDAQHIFLSQLHRMFRDEKGNTLFPEAEPTCAAFDLYDWQNDEFIGGIYSSPSVGAGLKHLHARKETCRDELKAAIESTIFFAGEHTNTKVCATVQSALDSGMIAAKEVLQSFSLDLNMHHTDIE